jgi:hypothetical protein
LSEEQRTNTKSFTLIEKNSGLDELRKKKKERRLTTFKNIKNNVFSLRYTIHRMSSNQVT